MMTKVISIPPRVLTVFGDHNSAVVHALLPGFCYPGIHLPFGNIECFGDPAFAIIKKRQEISV